MIKLLKQWFANVEASPIIEGKFADEYKCPELKRVIQEKYDTLFSEEITPATHPTKFNPFEPPKGWRFDPYYEIWCKINE
jgi:hypothetical protein